MARLLAQLTPRVRAILVACLVGFIVLLFAWWVGPGLFSGRDEPARIVTASVVKPADCTATTPVETVTFTDASGKQKARLRACGHNKGERIQVVLPEEQGTGELTVYSADTSIGHSNLRQSVGLLLVALSCAGGATYSLLVMRGDSRRSSLLPV
ncbi:hypothetical protein [Haloechinothrix halophila]|uniref:hypothetical protein n=1 Tax=Haloechinothrix halophila TaxID=1069073 RepID=UPI000403EEBF|nr:hypothetical protein [Haloechinothrix halophila]